MKTAREKSNIDLDLADISLVNTIKSDGSSRDRDKALLLLVEKHSGICVETAKKYLGGLNSIELINDVIDSRFLIVYESAITYEESRGAKFVTWVGNKAKFHCWDLFKKNKNGCLNISFDYLIENEGEFDINNIYNNSSLQNRNSDILLNSNLLDNIKSYLYEYNDEETIEIIEQKYLMGRFVNNKNLAESLNINIRVLAKKHKNFIEWIKEKVKN